MTRPTWTGDPLQPLLEDHLLARHVLAAMERGAACERVGRPVHVALWHRVLAFFDDYFDGIHHPKEEAVLLPLLGRAGFLAAHSPARRMHQEHELMQPYRQHLRQAIDQRAPIEVRTTVQAFVQLHRRHMALEEQHVFPMARAVLGSIDQQDLREAFGMLDHGGGTMHRERACALVHDIRRIAAAMEPDGDDG